MYFLAFLSGGILALITYRCFFKKIRKDNKLPIIPPKSKIKSPPGRIIEVKPKRRPLKSWNFRKPVDDFDMYF